MEEYGLIEIKHEYWKIPKNKRKAFKGRNGCPVISEKKGLIGYCKMYPGKNGATQKECFETMMEV